jgi:hypothetical protein
MLRTGFVGEEVELSGGGISLDLAIPARLVVFQEPPTEAGERLVVKLLDLPFNLLNVGHGSCGPPVGPDCSVDVAGCGTPRLAGRGGRPENEDATRRAGSRSQHPIPLQPAVVAVLRELQPLHADADGFVFVNQRNGDPIDQSEWPKDHWRAALRATGIRPRKFYATRHTFISVALSRGVNLKWLAEYCGTSVAMIERSYGRFLAAGADHQLALLAGAEVAAVRRTTQAG